MEKMYENYKTLKSINPLILLLVFFVGLFLLFTFIKKVVFGLFYMIAPVFFVAALILNYKVVLGYLSWLWNNIRSNPKFGLVAAAVSAIFYPFVGAYLAYKAWNLRGQTFQKTPSSADEYIKYEEVKKEDFLDISKEKQKSKDLSEEYRDLI